MMKSMKAQAALEFLVTYGWAILTVMIITGALMYFGFFDSLTANSEECSFGGEIVCEDYALYPDGQAFLKLRNNFGVHINITAMNFTSEYGTFICNAASSNIPIHNITPGDPVDVTCKVTNPVPVSEKLNFRINLEFVRSGSENKHTRTGTLVIAAQALPVDMCIDTDILYNSSSDPASRGKYGTSFGYINGVFTIWKDTCIGYAPNPAVNEALCSNNRPAQGASNCPIGFVDCYSGHCI
jgi:hypothetical protein